MLVIFDFSGITGAFPQVSFLVSIMASLNAWLVASTGRLPPVEQAKLWALREVLRKRGDDVLQYAWMAGQVKLVGGGHPTRQAVKSLLTEWIQTRSGIQVSVGRVKEDLFSLQSKRGPSSLEAQCL